MPRKLMQDLYKEFLKNFDVLTNKNITQFKNEQKIWTNIALKKIYKSPTKKHIKCLTTLVIRGIQIKTVIRYHFIPTRFAI